MLLLYGKYDPLTLPTHSLHDGTGVKIGKATGLLPSNISNFLTQAAIYFRVPGFREDVQAYIKQVTGISV